MFNIWLEMNSTENLMEARNPICTSLSCSFRGSCVLHIKNLVLAVNQPNYSPQSVMKTTAC